MEQEALYSQFNFQAATGDRNTTSGTLAGGGAVASGNAALSTTILKALLCPSDNGNPFYTGADTTYGCGVANSGRTCYNFSISNANSCTLWMSEGIQTRTLFGINSSSNFRHILDGTSNTVAVCETTLEVYDGKCASWACASHVGLGVGFGSGLQTRYINDWLCCSWQNPAWNPANYQVGRLGEWGSVGSLHPGGMQVVMADASVHWVSETIDAATRINLSRIADGETIGQFWLHDNRPPRADQNGPRAYQSRCNEPGRKTLTVRISTDGPRISAISGRADAM